jgi:hypothetical protein
VEKMGYSRTINSNYENLKKPKSSDYYVICDTSIMFYGTKKECLDYYNSLPNPFTMKLIKVSFTKVLQKPFKAMAAGGHNE